MNSIQQNLDAFCKDFTIKTRGNGEKFVTINDKSPLYKVIKKSHDGVLPHDWVFEKARTLCMSLSEDDFESTDEYHKDALYDAAKYAQDDANHSLLEWAKTFHHHVEEARIEGMMDPEGTIFDDLKVGQYVQLMALGSAILGEAGKL